jgi:hypothetical protein
MCEIAHPPNSRSLPASLAIASFALHGISDHRAVRTIRECSMSKGQKRSNKEAKKPKQKKELAAPPAALEKRQPPSTGVPKKKT